MVVDLEYFINLRSSIEQLISTSKQIWTRSGPAYCF